MSGSSADSSESITQTHRHPLSSFVPDLFLDAIASCAAAGGRGDAGAGTGRALCRSSKCRIRCVCGTGIPEPALLGMRTAAANHRRPASDGSLTHRLC